MIYVECPDKADPSIYNWVFLAGGITNCPDWQKEFVTRIRTDINPTDDWAIINPRRAEFDINNPLMTEQQIEWEYQHLAAADVIIFWFPYNTLCPITLYELGVAAARRKDLIVGCHPAYPRSADVVKQLSLIRPELVVHDRWDDMLQNLKQYMLEFDVN
jgi:Nucleoside 2-deoxyribosyltransferase like